MSSIKELIVDRKPFCFVDIGNEEVTTITDKNTSLSRGNEKSSPELSSKLSNIVNSSYEHTSLFIGVPCLLCYTYQYNQVIDMLMKSKSKVFLYDNVLDANLFRHDYDTTFNLIRCVYCGRCKCI